jgi:inositol hexakisphosphate/diphosphoinositol-pentakisphosphate kinase
MDHTDDPTKDLKVKAKAPLTQFLETVKTILAEKENEKKQAAATGASVKQNAKVINQLKHMRDILERWKITGLNRKLQIKPREWEEIEQADGSKIKNCKEVQLILKWGGNLTKLGEHQAIRLGERLRQSLYPDAPGGGILRLHSTFRHDLKIKTSDEGRVMKTAAAFAKGLLELEGEIPPILVSLVHKEKGSMHMLDPSGDKEVKLELDECKERITANLQRDIDWRETTEEDRIQMVGPEVLHSMRDALAEVGNPRKALMEIYKTMGNLIEQLEEMLDAMGSGDEMRIEGGEGLKGEDEDDVALSGVKLYKGETLLELTERWKFIYKRLYDPDEDVFDLSRIPDVHDNVRFDVLHNPHLGLTSTLEKLYELAKSMADCVVPQEYGTTIAEKRSVGVRICSPLLEKIRYDLNIARTDNKTDMRYMINMDYSADLPINTMGRRIRTRLYFTSESHLHTMLNCLRFAGGEGCKPILSKQGMEIICNTRELCYLTQIVIRLFEDTSRSMNDPRRFRVEILFSAGATATPLHIHEANRDADLSRLDTAPLEPVGREDLTCRDVEDFFSSAIKEGGHMNKDEDAVESVAEDPPKEPPKAPVKPIEKETLSPDKRPKRTIQQRTSTILEDGMEYELNDKDDDIANKSTSHSGTSITDYDGNSTLSVGSKDTSDIPSSSGDGPRNNKDIIRSLESKYFWSAVAAGTLLLGAGCIMMALSLTSEPRGARRRMSVVRT